MPRALRNQEDREALLVRRPQIIRERREDQQVLRVFVVLQVAHHIADAGAAVVDQQAVVRPL